MINDSPYVHLKPVALVELGRHRIFEGKPNKDASSLSVAERQLDPEGDRLIPEGSHAHSE